MAKRRKLEAPDMAELAKLEEGFAAKPPASKTGLAAPIAKVAAEAAGAGTGLSPEARIAEAKTRADAESWRSAEAEGRVLVDIPLDQIDPSYLVRDRVSIMREELDELKHSIRKNGQRLPVEVVTLDGEDGPRYGLISGWRRYTALLELDKEGWSSVLGGTIKAIIRASDVAAKAYTAMVEENEIRAGLSPYERGRIAVVAAGQGAFASPQDAVNEIFAAASKAKRSKIRSFALVHEELGDLLKFPEDLSERLGLRLANAVRDGFSDRLRGQLERAVIDGPKEELALLDELLAEVETQITGPDRSNRTRRKSPMSGAGDRRIQLANGISIARVRKDGFYGIRFDGEAVDDRLIEDVMRQIKFMLEKI